MKTECVATRKCLPISYFFPPPLTNLVPTTAIVDHHHYLPHGNTKPGEYHPLFPLLSTHDKCSRVRDNNNNNNGEQTHPTRQCGQLPGTTPAHKREPRHRCQNSPDTTRHMGQG